MATTTAASHLITVLCLSVCLALHQKITETVTSQPDYKLKWDDKCKVEGGNVHASFTIALEADFDEEVMEVLEMMEGEVAGSEITFQSAME